MSETMEFDPRARAREIAAEFAEKGDSVGWFEAFYREAAGDNEKISWADLEPNRFFKAWAEQSGLKGNGRRALVVGCGLGDDAFYLDDLGFEVTAFDISPTAIEWAKKLSKDRQVRFYVADLFDVPEDWKWSKESHAAPSASASGNASSDRAGGFDFVLEVYTIQPLPLEMRPRVVDAIAEFVAPGGGLVVVTMGREDDEELNEIPWPLSRKDLSRFEENGLRQVSFEEMQDETEETPVPRFVVQYTRK